MIQDAIQLVGPEVPFTDVKYGKFAWSAHPEFGIEQDEKCDDPESEDDVDIGPPPESEDAKMEAEAEEEVDAQEALLALDPEFVDEMAHELYPEAEAAVAEDDSSGSSGSSGSSSSSS